MGTICAKWCGSRASGRYAVKGRPARKGRHPRTGASIAVPASKAVRFRVPESPDP